MMDIVKRLRDFYISDELDNQLYPAICTEAADLIEALCEALAQNVTALDDWLHTYAHELCEPHHVRESAQRILTNGGTLSYIAELQRINREALAKVQP